MAVSPHFVRARASNLILFADLRCIKGRLTASVAVLSNFAKYMAIGMQASNPATIPSEITSVVCQDQALGSYKTSSILEQA
jgi:hypothetical protein